MKATFENTVDILVKAYLNNTLYHGSCYACAVGNLVASSCGYKVDSNTEWVGRNGDCEIPMWDNVFCTAMGGQDINQYAYLGEAKQQIDSTGYAWQDLAKIENAFESVEYTERNSDQHMLDGLFAVVDVLSDIHGIDLKVKEEAKLLFVKN